MIGQELVKVAIRRELVSAYIKCQARFNHLQFGLSKCFKMQEGKYKESFKCTPLYLYNWKSQEVQDKKSGRIQFQEMYIGKLRNKEVSEDKYLGNQINYDGTNMLDITKNTTLEWELSTILKHNKNNVLW